MGTESPGKTAAVLVVMLTFALGMAAGAGLHASFERPRHPPPPPRWDAPGGPKRLPPPMEDLELTSEQRVKAEAVFEKYRGPLEALFEETRPRMNTLREEMDAEFEALLTEQQRARFSELKARRPPHRPGFGPPPPPPRPE